MGTFTSPGIYIKEEGIYDFYCVLFEKTQAISGKVFFPETPAHAIMYGRATVCMMEYIFYLGVCMFQCRTGFHNGCSIFVHNNIITTYILVRAELFGGPPRSYSVLTKLN